MKLKLTAYFDQDGKLPLDERIALAKKHGIEGIGLRSYNGRPLIEMTERDAKDVYQLFKSHQMNITFLDGNIGGYELNSDHLYKEHLDQFKYLIALSDILKTNIICLKLPQFTKVIDEFENINMRLTPFFEAANKRRKRIWMVLSEGYKANTYAYIFKKMRPQHVDVWFDPVYFLHHHQSNTTAYRLLKRYIGSFACHDEDHRGNPRLLGYGKTDVIGLFKRLTRDRYNGYLIVDNAFYTEIFSEINIKKSFFGFRKKKAQKQRDALQKELSKVLFPNEQTRVCTYDDVLNNQIRLIKALFS